MTEDNKSNEAGLAEPRLDDAEYRRMLELALDHLGMGFILAEGGHITYASPTLLRLVGYGLEELRGIDTLSLIDAPHLPLVEARREARAQGVHVPDAYTVRVRDGAGRPIDVHIAVVPIPGPDEGRLVLVRDVTAERAIERRSNQAHRMEAIGHLCAGVTHDLNNYLTTVRLIGESLVDADDAQRAELLAELEEVTAGAGRLTHQLVTFGGGDVQRPVVLDMNIVVFEMAAMLRRLTGRHVELALNLEPGLAPTQISAAQLQQIVVNLAVNAEQAIDDGGRITVQTRAVEGWAELVVSDNGRGIEPEHIDRVFEPFFTTHPQTGSGMGLAIVYGIARQCGGEVDIESTPGEGTVVTVRLPNAPRPQLSSRSESRPAAPVHQLGEEFNVLVVEHEQRIGDLLATGLERTGVTPTLATLGTARDHLGRDSFHAMIVDVEPTEDIVPLVERYRTHNPNGMVVLVSGRPEMDVDGWGVGRLAVVPKPFSVADVVGALRGE